MTANTEALLTALYVLIDDHVIPSAQRRPGRPKKLPDSELVCLAVAQVLLGARSEHHWLRVCYARLGPLFPYLPHQPGYHKRLKAAGPLLATAMDYLARECPSWHDQVRLIDATPVPCGASRETVRRSELAGWAGYGYCAAHSRAVMGSRSIAGWEVLPAGGSHQLYLTLGSRIAYPTSASRFPRIVASVATRVKPSRTW